MKVKKSKTISLIIVLTLSFLMLALGISDYIIKPDWIWFNLAANILYALAAAAHFGSTMIKFDAGTKIFWFDRSLPLDDIAKAVWNTEKITSIEMLDKIRQVWVRLEQYMSKEPLLVSMFAPSNKMDIID